jgi:hypothetical protein
MNPGENPDFPYQPYNIEQLGLVTKDDGLGGYLLKTDANVNIDGLGLATSAKQDDQTGYLLSINNAINTGNDNTAYLIPIQAETANIETYTGQTVGFLATIDASNVNIENDTSDISSNTANQIKNILGSPLVSSIWSGTMIGSISIPAGYMICNIVNSTTGVTLSLNEAKANPGGANSTLITTDEQMAILARGNYCQFVNYKNCQSKSARLNAFNAANAPAGISAAIYYVSAP